MHKLEKLKFDVHGSKGPAKQETENKNASGHATRKYHLI
jgi:hypothetical protein